MVIVPDVLLVRVRQLECGRRRRHPSAVQEARPEVELREAEVKTWQHSDSRHLNDVRRSVHDAQSQLAPAQHRLSHGAECEFADAGLSRGDVARVWSDGDHLLTSNTSLAHLPLVLEVELARVDDVQVADAALVDLDLRHNTQLQ